VEPPPAPAPRRAPSSTAATVSLVFGLLWIFGVGSVVAVVSRHLALADARHGRAGEGLAVPGLVLGYLGLAVSLLATLT